MLQLVVFSLLISAFAINAGPVGRPTPDYAAVARRLVQQANWASVATTSTIESKQWPMVNLLPTAAVESTGEIFFYMMPMDKVAKDTENDNRITLMFTDAQEGECKKRGVDPWSHQCGKTMILGTIQRVKKDTADYTRGIDAFRKSHPNARYVPALTTSPATVAARSGHDFYLCKLNISNVIVYGYGYINVTPAEYLAGAKSIDA